MTGPGGAAGGRPGAEAPVAATAACSAFAFCWRRCRHCSLAIPFSGASSCGDHDQGLAALTLDSNNGRRLSRKLTETLPQVNEVMS